LLTIEEGSIGGFSAHVMQFLATDGFLDKGLKLRSMVFPDRFISHGSPKGMYEDAGMIATDIVRNALSALQAKAPSEVLGQHDRLPN
tara:strand:+ start:189 stop:449 length:261 start_codon:yes stop_codon:yes gene_type:complete